LISLGLFCLPDLPPPPNARVRMSIIDYWATQPPSIE
jgi:hypothetical protein